MKWGIRRSLEELGHKRKARKTRNKRMKALKKARKARAKAKKARENFEKNKEKYMKDPVLMNKHKDMFTTDEINKANQRFTAEQNLHNATLSKVSRPKDYVNTATGYINTAMNTYDAVQRVSKAFNKPLPKIEKRSVKEAQKVLNEFSDKPIDSWTDADRKRISDYKSAITELTYFESTVDKDKKKG